MKNKIIYTIPFIILLIFAVFLSFVKIVQTKVDFINFSKEEIANITLTSNDNKTLISKDNQIARILDIMSPAKKTRKVSNVSSSSKTELSITLSNREPAIFYLYENNNLFYIEYENITYVIEKDIYRELISYVIEDLTPEKKEFLEENFDELEDFYDVQVTRDFDPITDLKSTYHVDQAIYDSCYVYALKEYNRDKLTDFIESAKNKSTSFIREVQTTVEGDAIIIDIKYDSQKDIFTVIRDSTRDQYTLNRNIEIDKYEKMGTYYMNGKNYTVLYNDELNKETLHSENIYFLD